MAFENLIIRAQRSIRGEAVDIRVDGVITERFSSPVSITQNPLGAASVLTDHARIEPRFYSMDAVITDTPLGVAAATQIINNVTQFFGDSTGTGATRSRQAYAQLVQLQRQREPIAITTGLNILRNMVILDIMPTADKDTSNALFFTMDLQEVIIAETQLTPRNEDNMTGDELMGGASPVTKGRQLPQSVPPERVNQSVLSRVLNQIGGL